VIDVEAFRPQIQALLAELGPPGCQLKVVQSVLEWGLANTRATPSSHCVAMAAESSDGVPLVVLQHRMTRDGVRSAISLMKYGGFPAEAHRVEEPAAFLEHTVLHEIRHLLPDPPAGDAECDRWAFEHLAGRFG